MRNILLCNLSYTIVIEKHFLPFVDKCVTKLLMNV